MTIVVEVHPGHELELFWLQAAGIVENALMELGYRDVVMVGWSDRNPGRGKGYNVRIAMDVPAAVAWRAYSLVADLLPYKMRCWPCWYDGQTTDCREPCPHDWRTAPQPTSEELR